MQTAIKNKNIYSYMYIVDFAKLHTTIRHGVIVIGNRNRLQSITDFLVIVIAISVSKHHIIAIAINYIAKVITIFMTATIN